MPGAVDLARMRILLLTGTCGSGKSTVARLIAETAAWSRVSEDEVWRRMYHRARGARLARAPREATRPAARGMCAHHVGGSRGARRRLDATVHEASPNSIGDYRELLEHQPVSLPIRVLHPRLEVALERDGRREGWRAGAAGVESLWRKFSGTVFPPEGFLDTSTETPHVTAARALSTLGDASLR